MDDDVTQRPAALSPAAAIFWASFLGLFLELALIRWIASEVGVFAFAKNLVLVACFLGFGAGCFLRRQRVHMAQALFVLLLLTMIVRLPWASLETWGPASVSGILAQMSDFMVFGEPITLPWADVAARLGFAIFWTALIFFANAWIMIPFGQIAADGIARMSESDAESGAIRAYSINVGASLGGILSYTAVTLLGLPPLVWFAPVSLACAKLAPRESRAVVGLTAALMLVLAPDDSAEKTVRWTAYQKLALSQTAGPEGPVWHVVVNNRSFQTLLPQPDMPLEGPLPNINRFTMPYSLRRPAGRVLIVGAGSGNDASVALRAGATEVTAVEIDRTIYEVGEALHPQKPYDDPRVEVVIDDARHYLKNTEKEFDIVIFSHLDSHTLLSSYTNVRLDNYIYTVEAFAEARERLAPGGLLYVSFYAAKDFVGDRLARNLREAFDAPPYFLRTARTDGPAWLQQNVYLLTGEEDVREEIARQVAQWRGGFREVEADESIPTTTDAWPFLPLKKHQMPPFILLISGVLIALSTLLALRLRPEGEKFDGRVFWLGAAFMLVETHNVSRLALVFGTTWRVNAWVIAVILGLILLANAVYLRLSRAERKPGKPAVVGLFVSLTLAWLVPPDALAAAFPGGGLAATLLMCAPIFFAGLVFAEAFAASSAPAFALGWNVLGAVVGGMAENLSYLLDIPSMVPLAALFYLAALTWERILSSQ